MAMLSQSVSLDLLGCPAGICRGLERAPARASWKAIAAGFAAGALLMSGVALLASAQAPSAARRTTQQEATAAHWEAVVREQTPSELPREWRHEIRGVNLDGMFRKQR